MKPPAVPFITREQFESGVARGEIKPDGLFPFLDYDVCKQVWETSPLIATLVATIMEEAK